MVKGWMSDLLPPVSRIRGMGMPATRLSRRVSGVPGPGMVAGAGTTVAVSRRGRWAGPAGRCATGQQSSLHARWWPQGGPAGGSGEPGRNVDQFTPQPHDTAPGSAVAVVETRQFLHPVRDRADQQRRPHPHGVLTVRSPDGM